MVVALSLLPLAHSAEVLLNWVEPTQNEDGSPLTDLDHYEVHYGCTRSGVYDSVDFVPSPATQHMVTGVAEGVCYFAAKAVNVGGEKSRFSGEAVRVTALLPGSVENLAVTWQEQSSIFSIADADIPPYLDVGNFNAHPDSLVIDFTIMPRSYPSSDTRIISKATGNATQNHIFMISMSSGAIRFRLKTNGITSTLVGNTLVPLGQETTGRVEYDGTEMRIYVNGSLDASLSKAGPVDQTTDPVWVGANPPDGYGAFDGIISVTVN